MKKLSLVLAVILALFACAYAEEAQIAALTAEDLLGVWNVEYVTADGFMVQMKAYGITGMLTLAEDGSAAIEYDGEPGDAMTWYIEDGRAYISGYNPEKDVEMLLSAEGVLELSDEIGSMFLVRPAEETEE